MGKAFVNLMEEIRRGIAMNLGNGMQSLKAHETCHEYGYYAPRYELEEISLCESVFC